MAIIDTVEDFRIGRVIRRTLDIVVRNALTFLPLTLVLMAPMLAVDLIRGLNDFVSTGTPEQPWLGFLSSLLQYTGVPLLNAILVHATLKDLYDENPGLRASLSAGLSLFPPVLGISVIYWLIAGAALLVLIVPGLMVMSAWVVAVPVRVSEGPGFTESFGRSGDLTKGHRWQVFALIVITWAAFSALAVIVVAVCDTAHVAENAPPMIIGIWFVMTLFELTSAVGAAVIYHELRTVKEGIAPDQLLAAFD